MKTLLLMVAAVLLVVPPAMALPESLMNDAKIAFADIQKAKSALDSGQTKTSSGLLGKAEGLLKSVLDKAPGGSLLAKTDQASNAAQQGDQQKSQGLAAQAQAEAQKLDPSFAGQLGQAKQGDTGALQDAKTGIAAKTGLSSLLSTYEDVKAAKSLLGSGEVQKAKGLLGKIPSLSSLNLP